MQEAFTVEAIHAAAYSNNTVGLPKICPGKTINISWIIIMNYHISSLEESTRIVNILFIFRVEYRINDKSYIDELSI